MHARKKARDALFPSPEDDRFFDPRRGDVLLRDGTTVRRFTDRINRLELRSGGATLRPAVVAALALQHEILHAVIAAYRRAYPASFLRLRNALDKALGGLAEQALIDFLTFFPPPPVYRTLKGVGSIEDAPDRYWERTRNAIHFEDELILLWVTNRNPAYEPVRSLVSDQELPPTYWSFVRTAERFFESEPAFGPNNETLFELLLAPGRSDGSIFAQLDFIGDEWKDTLGLEELPFWDRLAWPQDLKTEEDKYFESRGPGPGEPLLEAMRFGRRADAEPARFSPDLNWMPNVVLIAKSAYVWLDQLTKKYERDISRLDQIPDEELDILASRHINSLWLIGVFERSKASRRIKQMHGDTEALASAYSLAAYDIATDLGGYGAYISLRDRAKARGIRLAADMVPNHVGIDGNWVLDHPDWFLQAPVPPYPNYRFGGPDLSNDPRVGIYLEEGYWDRSDAAVVFRRHDRWTGEQRFIYHGNDGTSMPWNDTAQLDYMKADVRRAVIETILHVAQMFPIIRFDAAMTLAKRHVQRLWYPLPGDAGAIPSRADYAMTDEEFEKAMPIEFWREVVDVVAQRAPDTLLLAEAFWMMEGYFVRTLGMHRVYNSAFMNMLKREENDKYRATITNVLDFDPEILKRFVNFMNNPDEESAALQFGEGEKYFGVCVLMCTMPGLPMFGHGQLEGFREKYGMEYRAARWRETPNLHLVWRHEHQIVPILEKRYLFSGVEHFALYDFIVGGLIDTDVFAFSNGQGRERALVLFNNRFKVARGSIHASTHRGSLGQELALDEDDGAWIVLRDLPHHLEYLRLAKDILDEGMSWELGAYQFHVLTDFRPVTATSDRPFDRLAAELGGRGVPSIDDAVRELFLRPIHAPLRSACAPGHLKWLYKCLNVDGDAPRAGIEERLDHLGDGLDWTLSRRAARDVTIERGEPLACVRDRFTKLHALLKQHPVTAPEPEPEPLPAPEPVPEPPAKSESAPEPEPAPESEPAPAAEPEPEPESAPAAEPEPTPTPPAPPAPPAAPDFTLPNHANLSLDLLLSALQLSGAIALLAEEEAAVEASRSNPPESYAITEENEPPAPLSSRRLNDQLASSPELASAPAEDPADAEETEPGLPEAHVCPPWAKREEMVTTWELTKPIVAAFEQTTDHEDAKRRAALVVILATLPSAPVPVAFRLALGSKRGQTFLDLHEASDTLWINKERIEDLANLLAERDSAEGRGTLEENRAEAAKLVELAEREGYKAERIAAALGPAPDEETLLTRTASAKKEPLRQ